MSAVKAERYAAYKDSGVEWLREVPGNWRTLRLKDVIEKLESGVSVNASDEPATGNNIGVLKTSCVGKDSFIPDENKSVWPTELNRVSTPVRAGRIIVSRMNTPQLVGASAYVPKNYPNIFLPDRLWQTVFFSSVRLDSKWLSLLIGCKDFRYLLSTVATGTSPSMKNLGQDKFLSISIPFPSHAEQTAIATYLDTKTAQIDQQIDLLSQKATQYGKLKQSLINETVTRGLDKAVPMKDSGVICIGLIPRHWKKLRLKDLGTIETSSIDKKTIENEKLVKLVNYSDIYGNLKKEIFNQVGYMIVSANAKQIKDKNLNQGDVLFTPSSETYEDIGVSSVVMENLIDTLYSYHILRLRFHKKIELNFKKYLFNNNYVQTYFSQSAKGTTRKILGLTQFNNLELVFPPAYKEQKEIAAYLDHKTTQIDRIINVIGSQIDKLKDLRKALINDVVTGKIKVVSGGIAV